MDTIRLQQLAGIITESEETIITESEIIGEDIATQLGSLPWMYEEAIAQGLVQFCINNDSHMDDLISVIKEAWAKTEDDRESREWDEAEARKQTEI